MSEPPIHVAIRSYKRPTRVDTIKLAPWAWIWVPESQGEAYRATYGDRVITIPDAEDGNPARKFNAILDRSPAPWTLILDDDISRIGYFERGHRLTLQGDSLWAMIVHHFELAAELGVTLWGINQNEDGMAHYTYRPFSLLAPILGPFAGHLTPTLRYDETIPLKEDYDFWLRTIQKHRKTLRANKYHYYHDHGHRAGGVVSQRTLAAEEECVRRMEVRWGTAIFKAGGGTGGAHHERKGKNILNCRVKIPIPGC